MARLYPQIIVKTCMPAGINHDELCAPVEVVTPATEHNIVLPIPAVKLPRRLEQLEKFADNILLRGIGNDTYHGEAMLCERSHRLRVHPQPFLKNDQAKQNLVIVAAPGGVL